MGFGRVRYMEWAKLSSRARYDLSGSGAPRLMRRGLPIRLGGLELSGDNFYGYPPLLEAIARRYRVSPDQIATAQGTSLANYLACAALLSPGDEVLLERPCYEPLRRVPEACGARVRYFPRRFARGFAIDPAEVDRLLTRRTRLVILTNLHNPSGVRTPPDVLRAIGRAAGRCGARVLVDEVYREFLPGDPAPTAFHLDGPFLVTVSLTKVFGLDGLRCGWLLAPAPIALRARQIHDHLGVIGAFPAEQIAALLFPHLESLRARVLRRAARNWALVRRFLDQREDLAWVPPDGGLVCFPRWVEARSAGPLVRRLRERYETSVVPGSFFGAPAHFRLGFGRSTREVAQGLRNLDRALRSLRPGGKHGGRSRQRGRR